MPFGLLTDSWLWPKFDAAGGNIKHPCIGSIDAAGSVGHDEIGVRIGVPRPKGITAFHQVIDDNKLSWIERVATVATLAIRFGLIEIHRD